MAHSFCADFALAMIESISSVVFTAWLATVSFGFAGFLISMDIGFSIVTSLGNRKYYVYHRLNLLLYFYLGVANLVLPQELVAGASGPW